MLSWPASWLDFTKDCPYQTEDRWVIKPFSPKRSRTFRSLKSVLESPYSLNYPVSWFCNLWIFSILGFLRIHGLKNNGLWGRLLEVDLEWKQVLNCICARKKSLMHGKLEFSMSVRASVPHVKTWFSCAPPDFEFFINNAHLMVIKFVCCIYF